jgi:aryl-alcohol dehydrogenase-like predicted oxidoreductase
MRTHRLQQRRGTLLLISMEYRRLGKAGVQVSALSLGSWVTFGQQISDDVAADLMRTAYDAGVIFFDNAEAYAGGRSETVMGNILKKMGWSHETYLVSSKVFWGGNLPNQEGLSRKHVMEACHNALSAQEITQAHAVARECHLVPPTMEQPMYNLFGRHRVEKEYARLYDEYGTGTTIWSPLASGLLTGKHKGGPQEGTRATLKDYDWLKEQIAREAKAKDEQVQKLAKIAKDLGLSLAVFSIAWCLKNLHVSTVILGASKVTQLTENLQAVDAQAKLTPDVLKTVDEIVGS